MLLLLSLLFVWFLHLWEVAKGPFLHFLTAAALQQLSTFDAFEAFAGRAKRVRSDFSPGLTVWLLPSSFHNPFWEGQLPN